MLFEDIKGISINAFWFSLGSILTPAISFILLPIYTRYLTPSDYGIISLAAVISSIFSILFIFGMRTAVSRFYYEYYTDRQQLTEYISTIYITVLSFGFICAIVLTLLGNAIFQVLLPDLPFFPYILLVIWTTLGIVPFYLSLNLIQMRQQSFLYGILCIIQIVITAALIFLFIVVLHEGALGGLKGQFIASIIFFIVGICYLKDDINITFNIKKLKESLELSLPILPHELAGWTMTLINRIFLSNFSTLAFVGLFTLGYQLGSLLCIVSSSFVLAWVPYFMSNAKEFGHVSNQKFSQLTIYYQSVIFFFGLCIILFSIDFLHLMTTPEYYKSAQIVPFTVIIFLFDGMYYLGAVVLLYMKRTGYQSAVTFSAAIINVILNIIFIPPFGMFGAAYAMLFSYAYTFFLIFFISNKVYPIPYDYKKMGKIVVVFAFFCVISLLIPYENFFVDIGLKSILLVGYVVGLIIFGVISIEELILLKKYALEAIRNLRASLKCKL